MSLGLCNYDECGESFLSISWPLELQVRQIDDRKWRVLPAPTPENQVGGHEGVGSVVKIGPGSESTGIKVGDRVGVKWISSACGRCGTSAANIDVDAEPFLIRVSPYRTMPCPSRRRLLQPKGLWLLYSGHIPGVRHRPSVVRDSHP
jgi:hypothetical protein